MIRKMRKKKNRSVLGKTEARYSKGPFPIFNVDPLLLGYMGWMLSPKEVDIGPYHIAITLLLAPINMRIKLIYPSLHLLLTPTNPGPPHHYCAIA